MKGNKQQRKIGTLMLSATLALSSVFGNHVPVSSAKDTFTMTKKVAVGAGESFQLSLKGSTKGISFRSSNKKVVTVNKKGKMKANKKGTAVITAKVKKQKKTCKVTVKAAAKGIKIENGNLQLAVNEAELLNISFTSGYSKAVTFHSEDTSIATVSKKGLVCGKKAGTTTITATTFNGKKATISCTVGETGNSIAVITATPINTASVMPNVTTPSGATATPTVEPTKDVTMNGTKAPEVTAEPTKTPEVAEETVEPTKTPEIAEKTTEPTKTPEAVEETAEPTKTPEIVEETAEPTKTPDIVEETVEPTKTPEVIEETAEPTETATSIPTIEPTESPFISNVTTASAVISKIEDGTIYVNEGRTALELTDCIVYQKEFNGTTYKILQEELFPGDEVIITYNGAMTTTYPINVMLECERILVTRSAYGFIPNVDKSYCEAEYIDYTYENTNESYHLEIDKNTIFLKNGTGELLTWEEGLYNDYTDYMWFGETARVTFHCVQDMETSEFHYIVDTIVIVDSIYKPQEGEELKPVIYLYPEETTEISVDLDVDGGFSYTYPYTEDGHWDVIAQPDGTLTNKADGLEYSYIFWEGNANDFEPDFSEGFCVKGEDITAFFQKVLPEMGLTPKEYNEFIVYWAPLLQNNPYNLISFQGENYEDIARLSISQTPDSILRVYMAVRPMNTPVEVKEQTFETFERKGFTVVEWGGGFY